MSHLLDHFRRDSGFTHHGLAPALDPVDSSRFLVSAVVPADGHHLQHREVLLQDAERLLCPLQDESSHTLHTSADFLLISTRSAEQSVIMSLQGFGWLKTVCQINYFECDKHAIIKTIVKITTVTLEIIFIPIASPVFEWKRM